MADLNSKKIAKCFGKTSFKNDSSYTKGKNLLEVIQV